MADADRAGPLRHHYGVYALIERAGKVLVVRKTRGPYEGWLDLPGGGVKINESPDDALGRELHEELGARVKMRGDWLSFSLFVIKDSCGRPIQFMHEGLLAEVVLCEQDHFAPAKGDEDVSDALWVPRSELLCRADVSALLSHALLCQQRGG